MDTSGSHHRGVAVSPHPSASYRIYSNKRRGAHLIFRATSAALIRGRRRHTTS